MERFTRQEVERKVCQELTLRNVRQIKLESDSYKNTHSKSLHTYKM